MPTTDSLFTISKTGVNPSQWPTLSCSAANQLALGLASLTLEANREISFQGNGQLRVSGDLRIRTGTPATENLTILANGNVGIGTNNPEKNKLHVVGWSGICQNKLYLSGGEGFSGLSYNAYHVGLDIHQNGIWEFPDQTRPAVTIAMDDNKGKPRFEIYTTSSSKPKDFELRFAINGNSGKVIIYGDTEVKGKVTEASSRLLKENISELSCREALVTLNELNPVKFSYKADQTHEQHLGFIAEDVPELVASPDRRGLSAMDIVAVLTKAMQEQQATIATLTQRLSTLEGKNKHNDCPS